MFRTHTCNELTKDHVSEEVTLSGWVHSRRDHGGIIFIDLRDRYSLTQVTLDPGKTGSLGDYADKLRSEWVIKVTGTVVARPSDMVNKNLLSGEIEVEGIELEVLSQAKTLPFEIAKGDEANESLRLKYRYLDLRRDKVQSLIVEKSRFIATMREYFVGEGFTEVQTPILASSSPEGARDFLIPSRLYEGQFYALPQAPQQFKQLLMVGGLDKYFQIAPCFRDEDPRKDRHFGEFYQLDMEMSFVTQEEVFAVMEPLFRKLTREFSEKQMDDKPFVQIPWREAMTTYGVDKPDLRFEMHIQPITELVRESGFGVFSGAIKDGGVVHAMRVEGGAQFSRSEIDAMTEIAKEKGAKGLAYIIMKDDGPQSPILKFLGDDTSTILKNVGAKSGDIIFFGADKWRTVCDALGAVRNACGEKLNLKDPKKAAWAWIVDFPLYDYSEIEHGKIDFSHNPFSMPQGGLEALENKDPLEILGYQYDVILNGLEISSGAIRNHRPDIMYKAFEIAGYTKNQVDEKFGHMIEAFSYGAPPHGGNAPGIDRLFMELNDCDSIRDIYAFPKDGQGKDLMLGAPGSVTLDQLDELHLRIKKD